MAEEVLRPLTSIGADINSAIDINMIALEKIKGAINAKDFINEQTLSKKSSPQVAANAVFKRCWERNHDAVLR